MKKLNQTELGVIAEQIRTKLQEEAAKAQEAVNAAADKDNLRQAQAIVRRLQNLPKDCKDFLVKSAYSLRPVLENLTAEVVLASLRPRQNQVKAVTYQNILNALILAQIESPDLNSLIRSVTKQFMTKP